MYHFYALNRAEFLQHYHKRSNIETTFHMIKSKFGQRLRSRTLTEQVNEALCKVLCHNLCVVIQSVHELGMEPTFGRSTPVRFNSSLEPHIMPTTRRIGRPFSMVTITVVIATFVSHAQATCIVVYKDSRQLIVAADSRRFQQEINWPYTKEAQTITKIKRIGRTIFASAGAYDFSVYDLAVENFDGREALSAKVDAFKSAATKSLQRMIDSLQMKALTGEVVFNPQRAIMQVLIVDYDQGGPTYAVIEWFATVPLLGPATLNPRVYRCPGDCKGDFSYYPLGRTEVIEAAAPIVDDGRFWKAFTVVDGLRALISMEINATDEVAGPIDLLRFTKDGGCWIEPKTKKETDDQNIRPCSELTTRPARSNRNSRLPDF